MKFNLFDYQEKAINKTLEYIGDAVGYHKFNGSTSAISLSAVTGSGKTVMSGAIIESILLGSEERGLPADDNAVVIWLSDYPSLNEQTKAQFRKATDLTDSRLINVDSNFVRHDLEAGKVYFINTQKLSKASKLGGETEECEGPFRGKFHNASKGDADRLSFWDILKNTMSKEDGGKGRNVYLFIDEAHRGMKQVNKKKTIVQNLISGDTSKSKNDLDRRPPIPIVVGISATPERFKETMKSSRSSSDDADKVHNFNVHVSANEVQSSGLLKDKVILSIPDEKGEFVETLTDEAMDNLALSTHAWELYAQQYQNSRDHNSVVPLMVVQMEDKTTPEDISKVIDRMRSHSPEMFDKFSFANVFSEHADIEAAGITVKYIEPQNIEGSDHIRVVFAKTAISTGWNCPRAEVLLSFRTAEDNTYITQIIGRMVRNPLAMRINATLEGDTTKIKKINGNDVLNSTYCVLPKFNRASAEKVAHLVTHGGGETDEKNDGQSVLINPIDIYRNKNIDDDIHGAIDDVNKGIISVDTVQRKTSPIPAVMGLSVFADRFNKEEGEGNILTVRNHESNDKEEITEVYSYVMDNLYDEMKYVIEKNRKAIDDMVYDIRNLRGKEIITDAHGVEFTEREFNRPVVDKAASSDARKIANRAFGSDLVRFCVNRMLEDQFGEEEFTEEELDDIYMDVYACACIESLAQKISDRAEELRKNIFNDIKDDVESLSPESLNDFNTRMRHSGDTIVKHFAIPYETQCDGNADRVVGEDKHVLTSPDGEYHAAMNDLENAVVSFETQRKSCVAWYRNSVSAQTKSLRINYVDSEGEHRSMYPDFVFYYKNANGHVKPGIVDPHGAHLMDAVDKLKALSAYAEEYGDMFHAISAVSDSIGKKTMRIDMMDSGNRAAIADAENSASAVSLYEQLGEEYAQ